MTKKKYSIPTSLSNDISDTIELTNSNIGNMNYRLVPLQSIEVDPNNPRELALTKDDLPNGPKADDLQYAQKINEFESLKLLANSIEKHDVRVPIEIYKHGVTYRLVHGERRYLGAIIARKKVIPAKVLDEKPTEFDLRVLQLIENVQRENLTLYETLKNIKMIIQAYKEHVDQDLKADANFIHKVAYKSLAQSYNYLSVLNAPEKIWQVIKEGKIQSLEKAVVIANEKDQKRREVLLDLCLKGESLERLRKAAKQQGFKREVASNLIPSKKRGKKASKIDLGKTVNIKVVKKIIELVAKDKRYALFTDIFSKMDFNDFSDCSSAFKALITIMEKTEAE